MKASDKILVVNEETGVCKYRTLTTLSKAGFAVGIVCDDFPDGSDDDLDIDGKTIVVDNDSFEDIERFI